jgi:alginate O-acetyltransferase complex protein AlgI
MLFNSYPFLLIFLPAVLILFAALQRFPLMAALFIQGASVAFYGYWSKRALLVLGASVAINFAVSRCMFANLKFDQTRLKLWLIVGVTANLSLLGYFKYADFFLQNFNAMFGADVSPLKLLLPLAISFYTFEQISYLIDLRRGQITDRSALNFLTFTLFFPRLLAGPIVRYNQISQQLPPAGEGFRLTASNFAVGAAFLASGLFKKVILGDTAAAVADPVFGTTAAGSLVSSASAIAGLLAFAFQIYFDFSGYSDMAIGLARMFGIHLPANFASPYKSTSIIEFWRRWHISLSTYLRDYLYFSLGGSHRGEGRKYTALVATMLLGGLWHGAGWNFVIWGALHGAFLCANHLWRKLQWATVGPVVAWMLTFSCVTFAWIFFRAPTLGAVATLLQSIVHGSAGADIWGAVAGQGDEVARGPHGAAQTIAFLVFCGSILMALPNTQQLLRFYWPNETAPVAGAFRWLAWKPSQAWALYTALLVLMSAVFLARPSKFIYFQF